MNSITNFVYFSNTAEKIAEFVGKACTGETAIVALGLCSILAPLMFGK